MKLPSLLFFITLIINTQSFQIFKKPNLQDAANIARTLISRESLVNINTVYQTGDEAGLPTSFVEYYADCGDGNPVILAVDMGTSFKNINAGSPYSLTVRTGDHSFKENVSRNYPGSRPDSVAGSPRINLRGEFKIIESSEEYDELEKCFLNRHKDAAWWLPGNPIHKSHFVKFEVQDAYFLGGFGDTGYIGKIPSDYYHNATLLDDIDIDNDNSIEIERFDDENINDFAFKIYMMKHRFKDLRNNYSFKIIQKIDQIKSLLNYQDDEFNIDEMNDLNSQNETDESSLSSIFDIDLNNSSKSQLFKLIKQLKHFKYEIDHYSEQMELKFKQFEETHRQQHDDIVVFIADTETS